MESETKVTLSAVAGNYYELIRGASRFVKIAIIYRGPRR